MLGQHPVHAEAALVIQAENVAIHTEGGPNPGGGWNIWSNGRVGQSVRLVAAGKYQITIRAWGSPAAGVWPEMALLVDGRAVKTVTVGGVQHADYRFDVEFGSGDSRNRRGVLSMTLSVGKEDRNLYLDRFTINVTFDPALKNKLLDRSLVTFHCEKCGHTAGVNQGLLYHDMDSPRDDHAGLSEPG